MNKLLLGFMAGAVLGILYAPARGSKTRRKLSTAGGSIRDGWNNLTDTVAAAIDNTSDKAEYYASETVEEINEMAYTPDQKSF